MPGDPRFDKVADQPMVRVGTWFHVEELAEIHGRGTADPILRYENNKVMQEHTSRMYGTGSHRVIDVFVEQGDDTPTAFTSSVYTSAARFRTEIQATHTTGGGGYGIEAEVIFGANAAINGVLAAGQFYLRMDAATRNLNRTYACLSLRSNIGAGNSWPGVAGAAAGGFIRAGDAGAVKIPHFLYWNQAAAADSAVRALTAGANGAMTISVNINDAQWFIPLSATAT